MPVVDQGIIAKLLNELRSTYQPAESAWQLAAHAAVWRAATEISPPAWINELSVELPQSVLASQRAWLDGASSLELISHVSDLIYAASAETWGEHLTSRSLDTVAKISLLTEDAESNVDAIYDPTAGVGGTLLSIWAATGGSTVLPRLLAQEINVRAANLARIGFYLSGADADVAIGDSLEDDAFSDYKVRLAVSQPPWGLSWRNSENRIREQKAFESPLPSNSDSQWLFALRMIEKLHPAEAGGGRALIFLTASALQSVGATDVRSHVLDRDLIDSVIALPAGLSPNTSIPIFALMLNNAKPQDRSGSIRMVDLRGQFETAKVAGAPRALTLGAEALLRNAMQSNRSGPLSRMVDRSRLIQTRYSVQLSQGAQAVAWNVDVPGGSVPADFFADRYPSATLNFSSRGETTCVVDPLIFFQTEEESLSTDLRNSGWDTTRLTALLLASPQPLANGRQVPLKAGIRLYSDVLPPNNESADIQIRIDPDKTDPEFLSSWLRSAAGVESIRLARTHFGGYWRPSMLANTVGALTSFADNLIVPTGPLVRQRSVASATAVLASAKQTLADATSELWASPKEASSVVAKFAQLSDESLAGWSETLPFPVAGAMWTLETKAGEQAKLQQALLTLEAYAAYTAAVLLSASRKDPAIWIGVIASLKATLGRAHLSLDRPTFGAWVAVCQSLSSEFRQRLSSEDTDEQTQLSELFGGANLSALSRIVHASVIRLMEDANQRRNAWHGHTGAANNAESAAQLAVLMGLLSELRGIVGAAWQELPLVRAGKVSKRGSIYSTEVALLSGSRAPFKSSVWEFGEMLDDGQLFIGKNGTASPLALLPIFSLHPGPTEEISTGYFFSRLERGGLARLVSYQTAGSSEITVPQTSVGAISDLW
jgi:type I restriction enzyme M protein